MTEEEPILQDPPQEEDNQENPENQEANPEPEIPIDVDEDDEDINEIMQNLENEYIDQPEAVDGENNDQLDQSSQPQCEEEELENVQQPVLSDASENDENFDNQENIHNNEENYYQEEEEEGENIAQQQSQPSQERVKTIQERHAATLDHYLNILKKDHPEEVETIRNDLREATEANHEDVLRTSAGALIENEQIIQNLREQMEAEKPPEKLTNEQLRESIVDLECKVNEVDGEIIELNGQIEQLAAEVEAIQQRKRQAQLAKVVGKHAAEKRTSRSTSRASNGSQAQRTKRISRK